MPFEVLQQVPGLELDLPAFCLAKIKMQLWYRSFSESIPWMILLATRAFWIASQVSASPGVCCLTGDLDIQGLLDGLSVYGSLVLV